MIFVIIINILLIIWIYKKYIYIPIVNDISDEELEELDPALIGYIDDDNGNSIDWILSEILDLNRKGYIEIEYVREDIDEYEYNMRKKDNIDISQLKKYELTAYRFLFSESDEISMNELEEKILQNTNAKKDTYIKSFSIRKEIEEELIKQNIIDYNSKEILNILKKIYMMLILIIICITKNIDKMQGIMLFIESIVVIYMLSKARSFSKRGKCLCSKIKCYKKELKYNKLLKEKKIMHSVLWERVYIDSIALNIMSEARREFIHDELIKRKIKIKISKLTIIRILTIIYCIIYIMLMELNNLN